MHLESQLRLNLEVSVIGRHGAAPVRLGTWLLRLAWVRNAQALAFGLGGGHGLCLVGDAIDEQHAG
jgi:hypothetical protein